MSETATRTRRVVHPAGPSTSDCCCRREVGGVEHGGRIVGAHLQTGGRPRTIATFRDGDLVDITLKHWAGRDHCPVPSEHIDPEVWRRS